jgi:hypothetical protein
LSRPRNIPADAAISLDAFLAYTKAIIPKKPRKQLTRAPAVLTMPNIIAVLALGASAICGRNV